MLASVLLGTLSDWLYDLLRDRAVFPAQPTWKAAAVLAARPTIVWGVLPELVGRRHKEASPEEGSVALPAAGPWAGDGDVVGEGGSAQVIWAEGGTITGVTQVAGD